LIVRNEAGAERDGGLLAGSCQLEPRMRFQRFTASCRDYRRPSQYIIAAKSLTAQLYADKLITRKEFTRLIAASALDVAECRRR
jgi:hypothetical protein